ncbi:MAG: hypothetical protein AB1921_11390 [Thermodesulfobacteriota bacterium]
MARREEKNNRLLVTKRHALSLGAGLVLLALGAGGYVLQRYVRPGPPVFSDWTCAAAAGLGILLCLFTNGFALLKREGFAERFRGIGFPGTGLFIGISRRRIETGDYAYVYLEEKVRITQDQDGTNKTVSYPVVLMGGRPDLAIDELSDYLAARRLAERVAGHLMLPLRDRSSGTEVIREPEHLNETVSRRMRRLGERPDPGMHPPDMLSRVMPSHGGMEVELPAFGFTAAHKAGLAGCAVMAAAGGYFREWLMIVFCGVAALVLLDSALRKTTLSVSRGALAVKNRGLWGSRRKIPADELEELILIPGNFGSLPGPETMDKLPAWAVSLLDVLIRYKTRARLVARSDKKTVKVFLPVTPGEADYLYKKILAALAN